MSLSYFNIKKLRRQSKQDATTDDAAPTNSVTSPPAPAISTPSEEPAASPVLDEEDEKFLQRLAAIAQEPEGTPPPLPTRPMAVLDGEEKKFGRDAQDALMDGANTIPLPTSPPEVTGDSTDNGKGSSAADGGISRKKSVMSYFSRFKKTSDKEQGKEKEKEAKDKKSKFTDKDKAKAATDLHSAAEAAKVSEQEEVDKEMKDLNEILEQLNLSAVNNRVFSFSKESEELLNKFKLVLVDVVNGVPTAYDDMAKLLTDSEGQLKKMYGSLPPFLQNLVQSLPKKFTDVLGPEIMAAQAEKPGFASARKAATSAAKTKIPSLKQLVTAQGAVATMLKSILNFLKLRFPALLTGTNLLLSLAVFLLMFVFWYCHKRGRETRIEKEGLAAKEAESNMASSASSMTEEESSSRNKNARKAAEQPEPPLIIGDGSGEAAERSNAAIENMPSVSHLPDPNSIPLPETPAKEEPLKVPRS